ncbi:MAG TPA: pseudouridine synthase [Gemmatimonadota bacterium]|nr:pseudouridine synthase [Gemmatimonadota bacterium]
MRVRLQRYLAQAGVASRRRSEDLIAAGLVAVNGNVVTRPGTTVEPGRDQVTLRGRVVRARFPEASGRAGICLALHKPPGVLTTRFDPGGGPTVFDLVKEPDRGRLVYVGRLDRDTEGLVLLTDDGRLAHRLAHPRWKVERTYVAHVEGALDERKLDAGAVRGIVLEDGPTAPFEVRVLSRRGDGRATRREIRLVLSEGRKREVRRILEACGGRVVKLVRTRYGTVSLDGLEPGASRRLAPAEVARLEALVGIEDHGRGVG